MSKVLPLTPPYDRYLVEMLDKREQVSAGGIVIPLDLSHLDELEAGNARVKGKREERKAEQREFRVLARGPGLWSEAGGRQEMQYAVGQTILALRPDEVDGLDWEGLRYYLISESAVLVGVDGSGGSEAAGADTREYQLFCGCGSPKCHLAAPPTPRTHFKDMEYFEQEFEKDD